MNVVNGRMKGKRGVGVLSQNKTRKTSEDSDYEEPFLVKYCYVIPASFLLGLFVGWLASLV